MENLKLSLDEKSLEALCALIKNNGLGNQTFAIQCRGPRYQFSSDNAVPALVTIGAGTEPVVRCPRLQTLMDYVDFDYPGENKIRTSTNTYCYAGERTATPVVSEKEFAANDIFECPYKT